MKSKLNDACTDVHRQRQLRNKLRSEVMQIYEKDKNIGRKIIKKCDSIATDAKIKQRVKNGTKLQRNLRKQQLEDIKEEVPPGVSEIVKGVEVFRKYLVPEDPIGPMICSKEIILTQDELNFLTKGSRFMARGELDIKEFMVDVEKMLVKNDYNQDDSENGNETEDTGEENDPELVKAVKQIEAEGRMVYSKENKGFDLGNLRASDYKFNKFVFLPRNKSVKREALNEIRRKEMIGTFAKAADKINNISNATRIYIYKALFCACQVCNVSAIFEY